MTTSEDPLRKRMAAANPAPSDAEWQGANLAAEVLLDVIDERSGAMTQSMKTRERPTGSQPPRSGNWAWALTGGFAIALLTVAIALLVFRGGTTDVIDDPSPTTFQPSVTTTIVPAPNTTVVPPANVPAVAATVASLSDRREFSAGMALGPDGIPIVASFVLDEGAETGTLRLFFCVDSTCEKAEIVDLLETPWIGQSLELVSAPTGDLYLLAGESSVLLYRDGELTTLPTMFHWPSVADLAVPELPVAFTADARPVFVGAMGEQGLTLVVCADLACDGRIEVPLDSGEYLQFPGAFVDGDTIRVVYAVGVPTGPPDPEAGYDGADLIWTTKVATVSGIDQAPHVDTVVVNEGLNEFPSTAAVTSDGSLVMWLYSWAGERVSYSVLSCREAHCSKADAAGLGGWAFRSKITSNLRPINVLAEVVYDPDEYTAYLEEERRIREEGLDLGAEPPDPKGTNIAVIECVDTECTSTRRSTIAAMEGWWYLHSLAIETVPNGTVYVLIGPDPDVGQPGLWLHSYPGGTLEDVVEPYIGTAVSAGP